MHVTVDINHVINMSRKKYVEKGSLHANGSNT